MKLIKNAGGMITGPFDSAVRSLLVGIIELGVEEVMVIGHTDCGVAHINADMMIRHLIQRGVSQDHIDMMRYCGIDFEAWLRGFDCVENSVAETVDLLRNPSPYARRCHHPRLRHQHRDRRVDPAGVKSAAGSDPNWADGVYFRPETVDKVVILRTGKEGCARETQEGETGDAPPAAEKASPFRGRPRFPGAKRTETGWADGVFLPRAGGEKRLFSTR